MDLRRAVRSGVVLGLLSGALVTPFAATQGPQQRPAPGGQPGGGRPSGGGGGGRPPGGGGGPVAPTRPNPGGPQIQPPRPGPGGPSIQPPRPNPGGGGRPPNPGNGNRPNPGGGNRPNPGRPQRPPQWGRPPQNRPSYNFRPNDRDYLRRYYLRNLSYINRMNRPVFTVGGFFPFGYINYITPLPIGLYGHLPPAPPGYQMGYYDGYVVVYDPLTYFIANVVDLLQ